MTYTIAIAMKLSILTAAASIGSALAMPQLLPRVPQIDKCQECAAFCETLEDTSSRASCFVVKCGCIVGIIEYILRKVLKICSDKFIT